MLSSLFSKKTTACPYCYQSLDVNKVAFRCSGRGEPGRPSCQLVSDPLRTGTFGDTTPVMPSVGPVAPDGSRQKDRHGKYVDDLGKHSAQCQQCRGNSSVRICPSCHSLLPHSLDNDSPLFGLVGVRNSGKTVLLSVLHKELVRNVARRFNAAIDNPGGATGLASDLARFEENMSREGGALPQQTDATGTKKKSPAVYEWKYSRGGKTAATIFSFYDTAGEDVSQQDRAMDQLYLGQSAGVILLLDPFAFPENAGRAKDRGPNQLHVDSPEEALSGITYLLTEDWNKKHKKPRKKINVPLAVVVSKVDAFFDQIPANHPLRHRGENTPAFDDAESLTIHDHMASLITQWGGGNLLTKLDLNYENYRLFGVSALGAEPDYETGRINSRGLLPHRVADPLLWLLADSGFIAKTKA